MRPPPAGRAFLGRFDPETVLITLRVAVPRRALGALRLAAWLARDAGADRARGGRARRGGSARRRRAREASRRRATGRARRRAGDRRLLLFAAGWLLSGVLPLIAIVSHFVYYAYYPALALSLLLGTVCFIAIAARHPRRGGGGRDRRAFPRRCRDRLSSGALRRPQHPPRFELPLAISRRPRASACGLSRELAPLLLESAALDRLPAGRRPGDSGSGTAIPTLTGTFSLRLRARSPDRPSYFFGHDDARNLVEIVRGLPDPGLAAPLAHLRAVPHRPRRHPCPGGRARGGDRRVAQSSASGRQF